MMLARRYPREPPRTTRQASSDDWTHVQQQAPTSGLPKDPVLGNLNTLTAVNYQVILPKLRRALCDANIVDAIRRILTKAYREPDSTVLCINILHDIYEGLDDGAKKEADKLVAGSVQETVGELRQSVVLPSFDPAKEYGCFCDVNVAKRTAVGRSRTLYPLLARGLIGGGGAEEAQRFFSRHVDLLESLVEEAGSAPKLIDAAADEEGEASAEEEGAVATGRAAGLDEGRDVDILAAVEVLLECCEVMVSERADNVNAISAMVSNVGGLRAFPSSRSRFKIADILSKQGGRPASLQTSSHRLSAQRQSLPAHVQSSHRQAPHRQSRGQSQPSFLKK
jgi:hypothetical protein